MPDTPRPAPEGTAGDPVVERPNNLPIALSSFVGRGREISEVEALLAGNRLLTLTGPGGSGKTRLALRVASRVLEGFEDGAWLVELAPLSDPGLVIRAVAFVLGVREGPGGSLLEVLSDHLRSRRLLLVLDNCEHLVGASASLAEALLRRCRNLSVLATSREALGVTGEAVFAVPPLALPDPRRPPAVEGLPEYEAARLFVERARAVNHGLSLTEENASAVAQVCCRLDGMPLAIELAAARAKALSIEQISSRLDDAFRLLKGGASRTAMARQRTLRATMDWSYGLLTEEERALLRRLSVFAGGFTLEAAEAVGAGGGIEEAGVLDLLASLVDKSLVPLEDRGGGARYRLLETVRQYASEKLGAEAEEKGAGGRHARYYLALAEEAEPELKGERQEEWLERLEGDNDNLRAAMRFLLDADEVDTSLRLAWALWLFWWYRSHHEEGRHYADEVLTKGYSLSVGQRAKVAWIRGVTSYGRESAEEAAQLCQESVNLFREAGDQTNLALTLMGASVTWLQCGYPERSSALSWRRPPRSTAPSGTRGVSAWRWRTSGWSTSSGASASVPCRSWRRRGPSRGRYATA